MRGVLCVEGFADVPLMQPDMPHPEQSAWDFLEQVSVLLGTVLDSRAKEDEMAVLSGLHGEQRAPVAVCDIYAAGLLSMQRQLLRATDLSICQFRPRAFGDHPTVLGLALLLQILSVKDPRKGPEGDLSLCFAVVSLNGCEVGRTAPQDVDAHRGLSFSPKNTGVFSGKVVSSSQIRKAQRKGSKSQEREREREREREASLLPPRLERRVCLPL